jgi:hypothetical protein
LQSSGSEMESGRHLWQVERVVLNALVKPNAALPPSQ